MSLSENDRVMLYGNRTEKLPTLAELSNYINSNSSSDPVSVDDITGISPVVETLLKADDAVTARASIGAGTSNLAIGTTASTAMAGNTPIPVAATWANLSGKPATFPPTIGTTATTAKAGNYQPSSANISDATAVGRSVLTAADQSAARSAIGAGTSNLALGITATTALAGNGNAVSASKLQTARAFTFSGAATGTGSFDGSGAVNIALTLAPVSATNVNIAADVDNGVTAATLQATISTLAARIQALENPTPEVPVE